MLILVWWEEVVTAGCATLADVCLVGGRSNSRMCFTAVVWRKEQVTQKGLILDIVGRSVVQEDQTREIESIPRKSVLLVKFTC